MRKNFLALMILLTSASFADTYNGILNQKLMGSIALDEFNSAVIKNPLIAYDDRHQPFPAK